MADASKILEILEHLKRYLSESLLPSWIERAADREAGGFLTYFDRDGQSTGETVKTFLMQVRLLYTMSSAHRAGYGHGKCRELAMNGAQFILDHYWDRANEGWI